MKKQALSLFAACAISFGTVLPSNAADGILGGVASFFGAVTAAVVDIPQAIVVDSLWRVPVKCTETLALHFGDENGFQQNVVGAAIGVPVGVVWGVPYGFIHGGKHALSTGWEKPFSTESYIVGED